jgi:hypothetical protein
MPTGWIFFIEEGSALERDADVSPEVTTQENLSQIFP